MVTAPAAMQKFEQFCRHNKAQAKKALRRNWQEQKKVEALWARFSGGLNKLNIAPASAMDLSLAESAARRIAIAAAPAAERAASRDHLMRLRKAQTVALHYERSLYKLRLPFLSREEIDRRAANWLQTSENLDLDYGDNEGMRAAYAIYGPKGG